MIRTLQDLLVRDEGLVLKAYPDPLTGAAPWTIGVGHTGPDVHKDMVITRDEAFRLLEVDITTAQAALDKALTWWRTLDTTRQWVLVSMVFNMGISGFLKFTNTIEAIKDHRWSDAKAGMTKSLWARQVGNRATRLANMMETGILQ